MVRPHCTDEKVRLRKPWFLAWAHITVSHLRRRFFGFFPFQYFYVFVYFMAGLGHRCSLGFSLVATGGGSSLVAACRLLVAAAPHCGARAPGCSGRQVCPRLSSWAPRLCCSIACALVPDQGSDLCLLLWQVGSLPLSHQGGLQRKFWISIWLLQTWMASFVPSKWLQELSVIWKDGPRRVEEPRNLLRGVKWSLRSLKGKWKRCHNFILEEAGWIQWCFWTFSFNMCVLSCFSRVQLCGL